MAYHPPPKRQPRPPVRKRIGRWVGRHKLAIGLSAFAWNMAAVLAVIFVFPNVSNLWVSIFVLAGGASASLLSVAELLEGDE